MRRYYSEAAFAEARRKVAKALSTPRPQMQDDKANAAKLQRILDAAKTTLEPATQEQQAAINRKIISYLRLYPNALDEA